MRLLLTVALVFAAGCAPEPSEVTPDAERDGAAEATFTDAPPPGEEQVVITSEDGAVDLGLTDRVVFMRLSPKKRAEIEAEMAAETEAADGGLGGFIAETVTGAVGGLLGNAVNLPVEDVRVTHDGEGRVDVTSTEGGVGNVTGDGAPTFDPADAERFVAAFERVRAERSGL